MPEIADPSLNPQIAARITDIFEDKIPFNKFLGFKVARLEYGAAEICMQHQAEFIGDAVKGILHGGVLSALIDATGGAAAIASLDFIREMSVNTVDMRVDYLRPASGKSFRAIAQVVRKGSRIVFTHVDVHNDGDELVACGTCNYSIFSPGITSEDAESQKALIDLADA